MALTCVASKSNFLRNFVQNNGLQGFSPRVECGGLGIDTKNAFRYKYYRSFCFQEQLFRVNIFQLFDHTFRLGAEWYGTPVLFTISDC